ncbi:MAG: HutD family protein [Myxococcota bacterium]
MSSYANATGDLRIVKRSGWTRQPWRNGKGTTNEVLRDGDSESFVWRISVAEVSESAHFSQFNGVDRILTQLEGGPLLLTIADTTVKTAALGEPCPFAGEVPVYCHVTGGTARDLNVMTRRDRVRASMARLSSDFELSVAPGGRSFAYVAQGEVTFAGKRLEADDLIEATPGESLKIDVAPGAVVYRIDIVGREGA